MAGLRAALAAAEAAAAAAGAEQEERAAACRAGDALGRALLDAGALEEALEVQAETLRASAAVFGRNSPQVASALVSIGLAHERRSELDLALTSAPRPAL